MSIIEFLKKNKSDTTFHSHVSLIFPKGTYIFNRENLEELWTLYCDSVKNKTDVVGIAEKPDQFIPVIVDVDIKLDSEYDDEKDNLYTQKHVEMVIEAYQTVLQKMVKNCTDQTLICVLLEKEKYIVSKGGANFVKNGFHLHFPFCVLKKMQIDVYVIPAVMEILNNSKCFEDLGFTKASEYIDTSCCRVPWLLYGSVKEKNKSAYLLTKIYDGNFGEMSLEDAFSDYVLIDSNENRISLNASNIEYYLPRILSIRPGLNTTYLCELVEIPELRKLQKITQKKISSIYDEKQLEIAKELIPMLSLKRSADRNDWMTIGWILFNISNGCEEGFDLWSEFSSRYPDYDETECRHEWAKMIRKNYSLGTLKYFASIDNPTEYVKFKDKYLLKQIKENLNSTHTNMAAALKILFGEIFVCGNISNKVWFMFKDNRWVRSEEGTELRKKISDPDQESLYKKFTLILKTKCELLTTIPDESERKIVQDQMGKLQKIITSLCMSNFKSSVMREAAEAFYDPEFIDRLDMNPYLIAFKNGVYDFKVNVFRPGRPEDYLSKTLPINYISYNHNSDEVLQVIDFFEKVFPDESLRNYFLDISSDVFVGGNLLKKVFMWLGAGDNGKSITQTLFEQMLGPFAIKFSTTVFTGKKVATGAANPDLARSGGGVRWAVLEEPASDETINIGTLKNLSGNDSFFARDLFQRGSETKEIIPMFKLNFICNELPEIKHADKATFNRIRVIPFESTFNNDAPISEEEQFAKKHFPVDTNFSKKIPYLIQPLAWLLIDRRKNLKNSIIEPEKVKLATDIYKKQSDIYQQFIDSCVVYDTLSSTTTDELFSHYKDWLKNNYPGSSQPKKFNADEEFTKRFGNLTSKNTWSGFYINRNNNQK